MKKILLATLIAFSMIAVPAVAWEIDIDYIEVDDASLYLIITTSASIFCR